MAISSIGLTQAEVDSIVREIEGQPQLPGTVTGPNTNSTVTTTGNTTKSPIKMSTTQPPVLSSTGQSLAAKPAAVASNGVAPAIVGVTTGFILGGPVGALIGGAGMWLLNKAIAPK